MQIWSAYRITIYNKMDELGSTNLCVRFISLTGLISNRDGQQRREGNFPFTARENATDRSFAVVKSVPRSLRILSISRSYLDSLGWEEDRLERNKLTRQLTNCIIDLYGVADWQQPSGTFDVRRSQSSRTRLPDIYQGYAQVWIGHAWRIFRRGRWKRKREEEVDPPKRREKKREREREVFEISSRKMIAYLRPLPRRYVRFRLTRLMSAGVRFRATVELRSSNPGRVLSLVSKFRMITRSA